MKRLLIGIGCVALAVSLCACENDGEKKSGDTNALTSLTTETIKKNPTGDKLEGIDINTIIEQYENSGDEISVDKFGNPDRYNDIEKNPIVTMEMEDGGKVIMELYPQIAPNSVENFISLINQGFYDGLIFHRVMPNFMAQGGDPKGDGTGGPGYDIVGEFTENGYSKNTISHDIGVLSMARANDPDSAGSQFFIVTSDEQKSALDNKYAAFGKVIEGMDEVYKIVNSKVEHTTDEFYEAYFALLGGQQLTNSQNAALEAYQNGTLDRPINPPVIKSITVDTFGVEYGEPNKK